MLSGIKFISTTILFIWIRYIFEYNSRISSIAAICTMYCHSLWFCIINRDFLPINKPITITILNFRISIEDLCVRNDQSRNLKFIRQSIFIIIRKRFQIKMIILWKIFINRIQFFCCFSGKILTSCVLCTIFQLLFISPWTQTYSMDLDVIVNCLFYQVINSVIGKIDIYIYITIR